MSQDEWDDIRKDLSTPFKAKIRKIDPLKPEDVKPTIEAFTKHWINERAKKVDERQFYVDKYGGIITLIQFPKKSFVEKNIAEETNNFIPKKTTYGNYNWYGPRLLLFKTTETFPPTITIFFSFNKENEEETDDETITRIIEKLAEPEDIEKYYIVRGTIEEKYRWVKPPKGTKFKTEESFLTEARKIDKYKNIESIKEVSKGELDATNYTFSISQVLKVG